LEIYDKGLDKKLFGKRLNQLRKEKGISSEQLSEMVGKSSGGYIRMIEAANTGISVDALVDICNALNVSPQYLLSDSFSYEGETLESRASRLTPKQYESIKRVIEFLIEENKSELENADTIK